jgi:hypothetical protein
MFGRAAVSGPDNITTTQVNWEYLTMPDAVTPSIALYSIIRVHFVNITLIRSETIAAAPTPFETCDASFQNVAYGGVVEDTDCVGRKPEDNPRFFGQVDTSAVLIFYGLGDGRSNISSKALDEDTWQWFANNTQKMDDLLVARGFILSVDPSLVTLSISVLHPAMSYLQMLLVLTAVALAVASYIILHLATSAHWSSSFLLNVIQMLDTVPDKTTRNPGYLWKTPEVRLDETGSRVTIQIAGAALTSRVHGPPVVRNHASADTKGAAVSEHYMYAYGKTGDVHDHSVVMERQSFPSKGDGPDRA